MIKVHRFWDGGEWSFRLQIVRLVFYIGRFKCGECGHATIKPSIFMQKGPL